MNQPRRFPGEVSAEPLLAIRDLAVSIGGRTLLDIDHLSVRRAEIVGLVGESGAGKSLLQSTILGILPAQAQVSGSVRFDGQELRGSLGGHHARHPRAAHRGGSPGSARGAHAHAARGDVDRSGAGPARRAAGRACHAPGARPGRRAPGACAAAPLPAPAVGRRGTARLDRAGRGPAGGPHPRRRGHERPGRHRPGRGGRALPRAARARAARRSCSSATTWRWSPAWPTASASSPRGASWNAVARRSSASRATRSPRPSWRPRQRSPRRIALRLRRPSTRQARRRGDRPRARGRPGCCRPGCRRPGGALSGQRPGGARGPASRGPGDRSRPLAGARGRERLGQDDGAARPAGPHPAGRRRRHLRRDPGAGAAGRGPACLPPRGSAHPTGRRWRPRPATVDRLGHRGGLARGRPAGRRPREALRPWSSRGDGGRGAPRRGGPARGGGRAVIPHEVSGGQRQRAVMARALAVGPRILLLDEPTSGLDTTVQARILELIERLRADRGLGILLISHNLGVVARLCPGDARALPRRGRRDRGHCGAAGTAPPPLHRGPASLACPRSGCPSACPGSPARRPARSRP